MEKVFGGVEEIVIDRNEFPLDQAREVLRDEVITILGYGSQGPGQSQNLRDNGFNVIVGQRAGTASFDKAVEDGWIPGQTLFSLDEAAERGTIIANLLSDAGQKQTWPDLEGRLKEGDALYFSHGFGIHFLKQTGIVPPDNVDVIMVAPKGAGLSVRRNFLDGSGINSSYAVHQDFTGHALQRTLAMGIGIGSGYLFETTFAREVISDHFGERAVLLGETWALAEAAYRQLRGMDVGPADAFIKSSEQITQVLYPLIGAHGVSEIYRQAQEAGELGTLLRYQTAVREATKPVLDKLYQSVVSGKEAQIALDSNADPEYRGNLNRELGGISGSEMWKTGETVREEIKDRNYGQRITNWGLAGAVIGAMEAQYQTLIDNDHSPSEAFNETVEEATQSLNQFYQEKGVAYLLAVCSTTAQRGALDWGPRFRGVLEKQFGRLGTSYSIDVLSRLNLNATQPNMWDVGEVVRSLRPQNQNVS